MSLLGPACLCIGLRFVFFLDSFSQLSLRMQLMAWKIHVENDLLRIEWNIKPYILRHIITLTYSHHPRQNCGTAAMARQLDNPALVEISA